MQAPQLLGIAVGIFLIAAGWGIRLPLRKKQATGWVLFIILAYIGALLAMQNALFPYLPTWSWPGVFLHWSSLLGRLMAPISLAFIGLLYRPNRAAGYAVMLAAATFLMMSGS